MRIYKYTFKDSAEFHKYDKNSPHIFRKLKEFISENIPDVVIEHVGSTAAACGGKGIIDIMLVHDMDISKKLLKLRFQKGIRKGERKVFVGSVIYRNKRHNIHIHLMKPEHVTVKNMIRFRKYLIKNRKKAKEYETIKQKAIISGKKKNKDYNPAKASFIRKAL